MIDYKRVQKECFWDLSLSDKDIESIANSDDRRKKSMLFEKILINSTRLFTDLNIFEKSELLSLVENYKTPQFNGEYIARRKNLVEVYFFDKPLLIDELKWIA